MTFRPPISATLATALLVAMATLPLRDVFGDWAWSVSVIGAAFAGALAASIIETSRRDTPLAVVAAITALGALAWTLIVPLSSVFFRGPVSSTVWRELADGVFTGWGALLDERFPLTNPGAAEIFATVLAWTASASAVHFAARRHSALGALGAGAAVLWIATAAALPHGATPVVLGAGTGAVALSVIATLNRAPQQRWQPARTLALLAVIGLAGIAATLAGAAAGSFARDPLDPRSSRDTTVIDIVVPDILAEFNTRREEGRAVLSIDGTSIPDSLRLRLQVYETHDGEQWLPATGFEELATVPEPEILPPGESVRLTVTLRGLDGPWVPLPDRVIRSDLTDVLWNEETQTALFTVPRDRFQATGTVVSRGGLAGVQSSRDDVPERLSEIPARLPDSIRSIAETVSADAGDTLGAIDAITARLRELPRDETVAPGNSFARLRDDLASGRPTGAEQIASLHALMLRAVGIPSRVVVGYVATSSVVESADLRVWTEVPFPGVGWIAFDPVPALADGGSELPTDQAPTTTTDLGEDRSVEARAVPRQLGPGEDPEPGEITESGGIDSRRVVVLVTAGVLVMFVLLIGARLVRRRFRRSRGWPADVRVLGAWAEVVDRLRELGAPVAATTTTDDLVYMATEMDEELGDQVRVIADLAARSLHAPTDPGHAEGDLAWDQLDVIESRIASVRGRYTRAIRLLDPRPLRYQAPDPPLSRDGGRPSRPMRP
jgi:TgpA N-terminal domain/Transglutaminase-like superfamily